MKGGERFLDRTKGETAMMSFAQFKQILILAESLTGIQFCTATRENVINTCAEFFDPSVDWDEDDHFYAQLADGRTADREFEPCKKSDLRAARKITFSWSDGTCWFFSRDAQKDGELLWQEIESEVLPYLGEYTDEDRDYTADDLIETLTAHAEK
jgi:hypothetical protein